MPRNSNINRRKLRRRMPSHQFICRLCRKPHPLRTCRRFLRMNTTERQQAVRTYGYCANCLAHEHSQGSCFSKTGCRYCHKSHHTLLHINHRTKKPSQSRCARSPTPHDSTVKSPQPNEGSSSQAYNSTNSFQTSLTAILKQNAISLLPTVLVRIMHKEKIHYARCLLDTGSKMSSISSKFVEKIGLTTLALDEETICPVILESHHDSDCKVKATLKVNNRIAIRTPTESLPESLRNKFHNLLLADREFYKSSPIDIVLGVDNSSRIMSEGMINKSGLPTAQNTIFGWVLYGSFST